MARRQVLASKTRPIEGKASSRDVGGSTRARLGDPQQYTVYRMEREEIGARDYARLSFPECKRICRSVCRQYGVRQARVVRHPTKAWAAEWSNKNGGTITLTRKGTAMDLLTVLHELAHHIHYHHAGKKVMDHEDHGKHFMAAYMSILDTVRLIPRDAMAVICDRHKIKYLMPGPSIVSLRKVLRQ